MESIPVLIVFVQILTIQSSAFILDGQKCVAYPPCTCSGSNVNCNSKKLTTFPKFEVSNITGSSIYMYLYSNQLTSIPSNAFHNLTVTNSTRIDLQIYSNKINSISTTAFNGIADNIYKLQLQSNNLSQIPPALKTLRNLNYIDIRNNPIATLSSSYDTINILRHSLRELHIDLKGFSVWPKELNALSSLSSLNIRYLNATHLDFNVFQGFENTLRILKIENSQLERIPVAVCHLEHLQTLHFLNNANVKSNGTLFEPCKKRLTAVTEIQINGDNIMYFPDILRSFPSLLRLYLYNNKLKYIHWDSIPSNSSLTLFYLDGNYLTRVPTVINKLHLLNSFSLTNNKIVSIEDSDFRNMDKLVTLYLDSNPIEYISPHAFKFNHALTSIHLEGTKLVHLPVSLADLRSLRYLNLQRDPIECSCNLAFLKPLNVSKISIYGNCFTASTTFKDFLTNELSNCP